MKTTFGIILISLAIFFLIYACVLALVWYVFENKKEKTGKTKGVLVESKHKKNVTLYERIGGHAWRKSGFIKNLTKTKYKYTVNGKEYKIKDDFIGTPRQTPKMVCVKYIKAFPRFAYIDDDGYQLGCVYNLYAVMYVCIALIHLVGGLSCLLP